MKVPMCTTYIAMLEFDIIAFFWYLLMKVPLVPCAGKLPGKLVVELA